MGFDDSSLSEPALDLAREFFAGDTSGVTKRPGEECRDAILGESETRGLAVVLRRVLSVRTLTCTGMSSSSSLLTTALIAGTGLSCSRDGSIDFLLAASRAFMRSYALPSSISSSSSRPGDGDFGDMARAGALCVSSSEADALFSDSVSLSEESAADLRRAAKSLGRGLDASVERDNGVERDDCGDVLDILNGHSRRNCITSCIPSLRIDPWW
jgi:hypothetical protein